MKVKELVSKLTELDKFSEDVIDHPLIGEFVFKISIDKKHPKFKKFKKHADKAEAAQQKITETKKSLNEVVPEGSTLSPEDVAKLLDQLLRIESQLKGDDIVRLELGVYIKNSSKGSKVVEEMLALEDK